MSQEEVKENKEEQEEKKEEFDIRKATYAYVGTPCFATSIDGVTFDYNDGLRVYTSDKIEANSLRMVIENTETHTMLSNSVLPVGMLISTNKKYYTKYDFKIYNNQEYEAYVKEIQYNPSYPEPKVLFEHKFDLSNKFVMIQMPVGTVGDTLAWFPYIELFKNEHPEIRRLVAVLQPQYIKLLKNQYPNIEFATKEQATNCIESFGEIPYACYYIGLFFKGDTNHQPYDFRKTGLHFTAGNILGVNDGKEHKPRFDLSAPRKIKDRYVCIATKSSSQAKHWNNANGWINVVKFLKESGYRVLCMDKNDVTFNNPYTNPMPYGAEDFTGNIPLQERINIIKDADFFIGLASGLSWVAWACNVPVVMISGFSLPFSEFYTPYRVINYNTCTGCWSNVNYNFDHNDVLWCPNYKEEPSKRFECTRLIHHNQVIDTIKKIPQYNEFIELQLNNN